MTFAAAHLPQFPDHASDSIILRLSTLDDDLIVHVPDGQNTPPNWDVYPILGDDPEEPEWQGLSEPTGVWDDALDDMVGLTGIELQQLPAGVFGACEIAVVGPNTVRIEIVNRGGEPPLVVTLKLPDSLTASISQTQALQAFELYGTRDGADAGGEVLGALDVRSVLGRVHPLVERSGRGRVG